MHTTNISASIYSNIQHISQYALSMIALHQKGMRMSVCNCCVQLSVFDAYYYEGHNIHKYTYSGSEVFEVLKFRGSIGRLDEVARTYISKRTIITKMNIV